jgi:hypothetical protein
MNFFVDLDLCRMVGTPGYTRSLTSLAVRRGDLVPFVVRFIRDGYVVDPGDEVVYLYFAIKTSGVYSENPALVSVGPFTKAGTGSGTTYSATVSLNTAALEAKFAENPATLAAMSEFTWSNSAETTRVTTELLSCTIANDIYRASDTVAPGQPTQAQLTYLPAVTGLTGGGVTKLDGVLTVGVAVPHLYVLAISSSSQIWVLQAGTTAEDAPGGVVRPDDYHGTTNAKIFIRVG